MSSEFMNAFLEFGGRVYRRRIMMQLQELDDHILKDIGLSRSSIEYALVRGR